MRSRSGEPEKNNIGKIIHTLPKNNTKIKRKGPLIYRMEKNTNTR